MNIVKNKSNIEKNYQIIKNNQPQLSNKKNFQISKLMSIRTNTKGKNIEMIYYYNNQKTLNRKNNKNNKKISNN